MSTLLRRIPATVYGWAVGLAVLAVLAVIVASTSSWHRTTREELFAATSQPDAAYSYAYVFSGEELKGITDEARTYIDDDDYSCSWYHDDYRIMEYQCDIEIVLRRRSSDFVPPGYTLYKPSFDKRGMLYGMVIVEA